MTKALPTQDGNGYIVTVGNRWAFVSSHHLIPDKEAQLHKLNKEDAMTDQHPLTDEVIGKTFSVGLETFSLMTSS